MKITLKKYVYIIKYNSTITSIFFEKYFISHDCYARETARKIMLKRALTFYILCTYLQLTNIGRLPKPYTSRIS